MTWRDGVHLTGTSIWCDATRRRDVCFVSAADRHARSAQLIGTPLTLALLGADAGSLAVPLRQRFTLGILRLELIASGRGPGAAALYVEGAGTKLLYAGAVRPYDGRRVAAADVRACDVLVVDAPFGTSKKKHPALDGVIDKTLTWTRKQLAAGHRPVLLVDTALDGLEVASVLAAEGFALAGAKPLREAAARMASLDQTVLRKKTSVGMSGRSATIAPVIAAPSKEPRATLWLATQRDAKPLAGHPTAVVSGRVLSEEPAVHFAWAHAADRPSLLAWIESTRARQIYVTGASAEPLVKLLGERARYLGPPQQLPLF